MMRSQAVDGRVSPLQGCRILVTGYLGLRSQARFSPGYNIAGLQPSEPAYDLSHVSKVFDKVLDEVSVVFAASTCGPANQNFRRPTSNFELSTNDPATASRFQVEEHRPRRRVMPRVIPEEKRVLKDSFGVPAVHHHFCSRPHCCMQPAGRVRADQRRRPSIRQRIVNAARIQRVVGG